MGTPAEPAEPAEAGRRTGSGARTGAGLGRPARPAEPVAPATELELLERARDVAGRTVGELSARAGLECPANTKRKKGFVGRLLERTLGATAGTASEPDFVALGIELKSIPLRIDGRPRETTFVCRISLNELGETEWEQSVVYKKLRRVLFVPVEGDPAMPLPQRRVGTAVLWSPDAEQEAALRRDWERVAALVARGEVEQITGRLGDVMQVRPKAANNRERTRAPEGDDGAYLMTLPRGFYLRTQFTGAIIAHGLRG